MQLFFNGQALFNSGAAAVTADTAVIRAESGRPLRLRTRLHVHAYLEYANNTGGQAALTSAENSLRSQLQGAYGDLVLKQDSGAYSGLALVNSNSISGVVIDSGPTFTEAEGSEYVNRRTVEFTGVAEYVIANTKTAIVSWKESLVFTGTGGPVTRWRPSVNTKPIQQQIYPFSTYKLVQTGRAVGHRAYPVQPTPFFAYPIEQVDRRRVINEAPTRIGKAQSSLVNYPITWEYYYESASPLVAVPNLPKF
jgi:hypothetical protein